MDGGADATARPSPQPLSRLRERGLSARLHGLRHVDRTSVIPANAGIQRGRTWTTLRDRSLSEPAPSSMALRFIEATDPPLPQAGEGRGEGIKLKDDNDRSIVAIVSMRF